MLATAKTQGESSKKTTQFLFVWDGVGRKERAYK